MFPGAGEFPEGEDAGDMMMDGGDGSGGEDEFADAHGAAGGFDDDAMDGAVDGLEDGAGGDDVFGAEDGPGAAGAAAGGAAEPAMEAAASQASAEPAVNPMAEFNRSYREKGEAKDADERDAIRASRARGEKELAAWMAEKEAQLEARKQQNRTDEEAKLVEMEAALSEAPWTRVLALVDTTAPATDGSAGHADPARMRELLIQLKSSPPQAAAEPSA